MSDRVEFVQALVARRRLTLLRPDEMAEYDFDGPADSWGLVVKDGSGTSTIVYGRLVEIGGLLEVARARIRIGGSRERESNE